MESNEDDATGQGKPPTEVPSTGVRQKDWLQSIFDNDDNGLKSAVASEIESILTKHNLERYYPLFLFDTVDSITIYHSDRLYAAASDAAGKKDILLFIESMGGSIEPAYLISKTLKRLSAEKFVVAVPRAAKSAATLVALGADEVHMGLVSQLGPIDPQVGGLPALALGNALDVIANLACRFPDASGLFSNYLNQQTSIRLLGYYQRVNESAVQYAERLLEGKAIPPGKTPNSIADHMVNHYKDHGFVIDIDEARSILGDGIVKIETPEYRASDEIYRFLDFMGYVLRRQRKQDYWLVGKLPDGLATRDRPSS